MLESPFVRIASGLLLNNTAQNQVRFHKIYGWEVFPAPFYQLPFALQGDFCRFVPLPYAPQFNEIEKSC